MKYIYSLAIMLLITSSILFAQQNPDNIFSGCGSDQLMNMNPQLVNAQNLIDANIFNSIARRSGNPGTNAVVYTIPVVVHIVHNGGPENISDVQVQNAIANFNTKYAQNPGDQIQLCLAQRDPAGNSTNGITRNVSTLTTETMEADDIALKNINRWPPTCYLNIWVIKEILSSSQGSGVVGYAYFPSAHGLNMDGLVIEANYFGSSVANDAVGAHEIGHYFGLYHTFQNGCGNNNCLLDGDRVCDTPPDQTTFASCSPPANSCATDTDDTSLNNPLTSDVSDNSQDYMDYSAINCYTNFTDGQYSRMVYFLLNVRSSLLSCNSCSSPCPTPLAANITTPATTLNIVTGTTVNFSGVATNAISCQWYLTPNTILSTAISFNYTFTAMGSHWMKFKGVSSNNTVCSDAIDSILVEVTQPVVTSCKGSINLDSLNSAVRLPLTNQNYSSNGFTWECWFKLNSGLSGNSFSRTLINQCDDVQCEDIALCFGWIVPAISDHLVFRVDGPGGCGAKNPIVNDYIPPGGFVVGTWYHAAGAMDYVNHISKLYLNGQLVSSKANNAVPITRAAVTEVGWDGINTKPLSPEPPTTANVDEIRVWNKVRTDAEILADYNTCLQGNEPNLLSYYRCNQSAGTAAVDASSNKVNGTLKNGAAWSNLEPGYASATCFSTCIEICNNGMDDNSNGLTDEDCFCPAIVVSRDTTLCKGSSAPLTASGAATYVWSPATGLSITSGSSVTATPTVTTTYTVATTYDLANSGNSYSELVFNWDFALGNVGFTNDYTFAAFQNPGNYFVGPGYYKYILDTLHPDHTATSDNMYMPVDGKSVPGRLWEQTINTIGKNQNYKFSFWASRADVTYPHFVVHFIGDVTGDTIVGDEIGQLYTGVWPVWDEYSSIIWNSQANNKVTIRIFNLETGSFGNDFILDDISLKLVPNICRDTATVKVVVNNIGTNTLNLGNDLTLCVSGTHTFHAGPGFEEYKWQDGSTDSVLTAYGTGKYWVTVKNYCSSVYLSDTVSITMGSTPSLDLGNNITLCKKDSAVLGFTTNGVYSTFHWFPDSGLSCTNCPAPIAKPNVSTKYYLLATTGDGCTNIDSVFVNVSQSCLSAIFTSSDSIFCAEEGKCVDFTDHTIGTPTGWKWLFPGATPDSSTQQNPTGICYYLPGTYSVTLIVFGANGSDTLVISSAIKAQAGTVTPIVTQQHDTLFCTHAASYQWYLNGIPIAGATDSLYVTKGDGTYSVRIFDDAGCTSVSDGILINSTNEFLNEAFLTVYPNPMTSSSTLHFSILLKDAEVFIYDMLGKEVLRQKLTGNKLELKKGTITIGDYFIRVLNNERQYLKKIVIQ